MLPNTRHWKGWIGAATLSGVVAVALPAGAQEPVKPSPPVPGASRPVPQPDIPTPRPASPDAAFVNQASASSAREIELGKVASTHATSSRVREFADRMVADHAKAAAALRALSVGKGWVTTKPGPHPDQAALERMRGTDFDRAYMDLMVKAHDDAITAFEAQAMTGMDVELKAWARQMLPTIRDHKMMATEMLAGLNATAR
jgi:putative membrane protein